MQVVTKKMICTICKSQEEKLKLMPCTNMTFIKGSANFKSSTLLDHVVTDGHKRAVKKNHEDAISTGSSTCLKNVIHKVLTYSAMAQVLEKWPKTLVKLYNIAHYITVNPFMHNIVKWPNIL